MNSRERSLLRITDDFFIASISSNKDELSKDELLKDELLDEL